MAYELTANRRTLKAMTAAAAFLAAMAGAHEASAQEDTGSVTPDGKAIVGGALLGAEIVAIPMGLAGVEAGWPYLVFPPLGAVGGAVGGWGVEQALSPDGPAEPALYMLAGGLALIIPALVVSLNAVLKDDFEDDPSVITPEDEAPPPGTPGAAPPGTETPGSPSTTTTTVTSRAPAKRVRRPLRLSVLDVYGGDVSLGVPAVEVRQVYTRDEMAKFGVEQRHEVRVPVFQTAF